jgi:adenylate cyclase
MSLSRRQKRRLASIPIGLGVGILFCILQVLGVFESYELKSADFRFGLRGSEQLSNRISLVVVDNQTLQTLGWPVRRAAYAGLVSVADNYGARVVGFDVLFTDPGAAGPEEDQLFAEAARMTGNVVFPAEFTVSGNTGDQEIPESYLGSGLSHEIATERATAVNSPIKGLAEASRGMCHLLLDNRGDGVFRKVPLFIGYKDKIYPALGLRLVLDYLGVKLEGLTIQDGKLSFADPNMPRIPVAGDGNASIYINYKTVAEDINFMTLVDVLQAYRDDLQGKKPEFDLEKFFKNKLVLVGQTAASIGDHGPTPLSNSSPLMLAHANVIHNLFTGEFLVRAGWLVNWIFILLICGLVGLLAGRFRMQPGAGATFGVLAVWTVVAHWIFSGWGYWIDMIAPLCGGLFVYMASSIFNHFVRDRDERMYRSTFERYVAPGLIDRILENPDDIDTIGATKRLTILFSDIKGYTVLSQEMSAAQVLSLLREYLDVMTRVLFRHGGTIDKIMGDGILAFFGDPLPQEDHPFRAVRAALEMQQELNGLQRRWISEGLAGLQVRIGISTGLVYVGNIGSEHHVEYTVIGRTVNLAARLESKAPPGGVLVSQETYDEIKDAFDCEEIPGLELKGYRETYKGFWVFSAKPEQPKGPDDQAPEIDWADRRDGPRIELVTGLKYHSLGGSHVGRALNASRTGIFISGDEILPVGTDLTIESQVHAGEELLPVWITGKVKHVRSEGDDQGMGVKFDYILADQKETIRYFMRDVFGLQAFEEMAITTETQDDGTLLYRYEFVRPMEKYTDRSPEQS